MEADGDVVSVDRGCGRTRPQRWYSLHVSAADCDEKPAPRVGHTATTLPHRAQVLLIGGASPDALYDEAWRLDLNRLQISRVRLQENCPFPPRYEHCALLAPTNTSDDANDDDANDDGRGGDRIWVFAGANMDGNLSDLWELEIGSEQELRACWRRLWCSGDPPSPRTLHTATALLGNSLTLFGGGLQAASPVEDASVYQLDALTRTWTLRHCSGTPPSPRQGHVLVAVQDKLLVHGGMASNTFFSDLFVLSQDGQWLSVPDVEPNPGKRAGHGCVLYKKWVYIWGGLGPHGSLGDLWRLDTESLVWEEVCGDGASPKPRLDFAMSIVHLPIHFAKSASSSDSRPNGEANGEANGIDDGSTEDSDPLPFILLHGGMDDQGSIYDDFHVFRLES